MTPELVKRADLILCMGKYHKMDLVNIFPHFKDKIYVLKQFASANSGQYPTIDDPYGGPKKAYVKTFLEIKDEVYRIWPEIKRLAGVKTTEFTD